MSESEFVTESSSGTADISNTASVTTLRNLGFTWSQIADFCKVDRRTLYRLRKGCTTIDANASSTALSNDELDETLKDILKDTPNAGEIYVIGALKAKNIKIPRARIRDRLRIVDADGRSQRRRSALKRRIYNVGGANYLWLVSL